MATFASIAAPQPARARWASVRIETDEGVYVGRMFIPEMKKRLSDVLCDDRPFIALTGVTKDHSAIEEPFVAINKRFVRTVRVIQEMEAEAPPLRTRR